MTITDEDLGALLEPAPSPRRRLGRRAWLAIAAVAGVLLVIVAFVIGGNGNGGSTGGAASSSPSTVFGGGNAGAVRTTPVPAPAGAGGAASSAAGTSAGVGVTNGADEAAPSTVPGDVADKVVKTGEMDLQVGHGQVPHTLDRLIGLATVNRGFVAESHSSDGVTPSGSVTLRIPVQAFDATVTAVRQLPGKVMSQQTSGEDVTSKYVDLQARIHALTATRSSFERLLARATTIGDTLAVQSRITEVQTEIEQLQGQLRVLADQATYGTLAVTVSETGPTAAKPHHASGISKAFHRSVDRFVNGVEAIVGILGPLLLVALLAALAWLIVRFVMRRTATAGSAGAGPSE